MQSPPASRRVPTRAALIWHALAALTYLALSLWFLRPIASLYASHIAPDLGDPVFNLVILKWGVHQLSQGLPDFWNAPFFFPAPGAITYSDHLIGPAAVAWLLRGVLPNALAAYNLLLLASFVVSAWSTWFVLRRAGVGVVAAFLGGVMFAFSPFRWDQMSHLQVLLMLWIPLLLWTWDRLLAAPSWRRALVFLLFYVLHGTGGAYLAYMVHVPIGILLLFRGKALWRRPDRRRVLAILAPTGAACLALMLALFLPYARRSEGQSRRPVDIVTHGATLASFAAAPPSLFYGDFTRPWRRNENSQFAGLAATALALLAVSEGWRGKRRRPRRPLSPRRRAALGVLMAFAAFAFMVAELRTWALTRGWHLPEIPHFPEGHRLGVLLLLSALAALLLRRLWGGNWPVRLDGLDPWRRGLLVSTVVCSLLMFPAIYLAVMRIVPGLAGMRVPARFYAFVSFGIVWFAAQALDRLLARQRRGRRPWIAAGFAALILVEVSPRAWEWQALATPAESPEVYRWLAETPAVRATLELPLDDNMTQIQYMYFWSSHWKPMVNGYSGFLAPHFERLRQTGVRPAPTPEELASLRSWGVTHLVVHPGHLERRRPEQRFWEWVERETIPLVYDDGEDLVFSLSPAAAAAPALDPIRSRPRERSFRDGRFGKSPPARRRRSGPPPPDPRTPRTPPPPPGR